MRLKAPLLGVTYQEESQSDIADTITQYERIRFASPEAVSDELAKNAASEGIYIASETPHIDDRKAWAEHYLDKIFSLNPMDLLSVGLPDEIADIFRKELRMIIAENGLDAVVIFAPGKALSNQTGEPWIEVGDTGFGFRGFDDTTVIPYVLGHLHLIEAATGKRAHRRKTQAWGESVYISFKSNWSEYNPHEKSKLMDATMPPLELAIKEALKEI